MEAETPDIDRRQFLGTLACFMGLAVVGPSKLLPLDEYPLSDLGRVLPYFARFIGSVKEIGTRADSHLFRLPLLWDQRDGTSRPNDYYCEFRTGRWLDNHEQAEYFQRGRDESYFLMLRGILKRAEEHGYTKYRRIKVRGEERLVLL